MTEYRELWLSAERAADTCVANDIAMRALAGREGWTPEPAYPARPEREGATTMVSRYARMAADASRRCHEMCDQDRAEDATDAAMDAQWCASMSIELATVMGAI